MTSILMVAGEASGDLYGSHLIHALKQINGTVAISAMGGKAMKAAGAEIVFDCDKIAVMGIVEVFAQARSIWRARSVLKEILIDQRPDLLILIDYPGFNLHMAKIAKALDIKVLYYISPKLWAWRPKRVKKIRARVSHMAVILPFEEDFYHKHGVPVSFVGHPLMDTARNPSIPPRDLPAADKPLTIGLWPGSRKHEVTGLLPMMMQAGRLILETPRQVRFLISCAPSIDRSLIEKIAAEYPLPQMQIVNDPAADLFPQCQLAIVASGTVTLEAAIYCTPMIITYNVSWLSYQLGKALIHVDHIGLVNLIAEKRIAPELIQHQATPQAVAQAALDIVASPESYQTSCRELEIVRQRLGSPGASQQVAELAVALKEGTIP